MKKNKPLIQSDIVIDRRKFNIPSHNTNLFKQLIKECDQLFKSNPSKLALFIACGTGDLLKVKELLNENEYDINEFAALNVTYLMIAALFGRLDVIAYLLTRPDIEVSKRSQHRFTALLLAYSNSNYPAVKLLLKSGHPHPYDVFNLLTMACYQKDMALASFLFNGNLIEPNKFLPDSYVTPLMAGCTLGEVALVEYLLQLPNINVNIRSKFNFTALMMACNLSKSIPIIKMLLKSRNIDVNAETVGGATALILACEEGDTDVVKCLLTHPLINLIHKDKEGKTAHTLCCYKK